MDRGTKVIINCKQCGKEFVSLEHKIRKGKGLFCSHVCVSAAMKKGSTVPCKICGKPIYVRPSKANHQFCSKKCMGIGELGHTKKKKTGIMKTCEVCGEQFYTHKARIERSRFCSRKCQIAFFLPNRTGELSPWFKGGISIRQNGADLPYKYQLGDGKGSPVHRLIGERVLGRKLSKDEIVHHIDGNSLNNSNDNLLICTRDYHVMLHHRMEGGLRRHAQV